MVILAAFPTGCETTIDAVELVDAAVAPGRDQTTDSSQSLDGNPCAGIDCSGHGRCAVFSDGHAECLCEPGYIAQGLRECVPEQSSRPKCLARTDCSADTVCSITADGCVSPICGLSSGAGSATETQLCGGSRPDCAAGLTCVPLDRRFDQALQRLETVEGRCHVACDPCQPLCPSGHECFQLPEGGGFCNPGPLGDRDDACNFRICGGFSSCCTACAPPRCINLCRPAPAPLITSAGASTANEDCGSGEVCQLLLKGTRGDAFACTAGSLAVTGQPCEPTAQQFCQWPDTCQLGTCSPPDCRQNGCPGGVGCFEVQETAQSRPVPLCVADGTRELNAPCAEDQNCVGDLRCLAPGQGETRGPVCFP